MKYVLLDKSLLSYGNNGKNDIPPTTSFCKVNINKFFMSNTDNNPNLLSFQMLFKHMHRFCSMRIAMFDPLNLEYTALTTIRDNDKFDERIGEDIAYLKLNRHYLKIMKKQYIENLKYNAKAIGIKLPKELECIEDGVINRINVTLDFINKELAKYN
jgi:hypothetical protein